MRELAGLKKIGILGGTFDPIHMGHLLLAQWALEEAQLEAVVFMPTGMPYFKRDQGVLRGELRLRMVELAIQGREEFLASDMEILREGNTYTYETLEAMRERCPEAELTFIEGADCLDSIDRWKNVRRIFQNCTLLAAAREGASMEHLEKRKRELEERYGARIRLMPFPRLEISSTLVRRRAAQGRSIAYLVPEQVRRYIEENRLYQ